MASAGFDPMTSAKNVERLRHSGYVWFLVCTCNKIYLRLGSRQATHGFQCDKVPIPWGVCYNSNPQKSRWSGRPTWYQLSDRVTHMVTCFITNFQAEYIPPNICVFITIGLEHHHILQNRIWVNVLKVGLYGYYYNMVLTILKANERVCHFKGIF